MVIKDALLRLLTDKEYADVTIADLCREAEINRGTFYLHYSNLREVLEELLDDALQNMNGVLVQIGCAPAEKSSGVPLCRFLRENKKYQPLFFSDSLHSHVIERIAADGWQSFCTRMSAQSGLDEAALKAIFFFQLNGCLAISQRNIDISDDSWALIQCQVDRFLKNGLANL
jgi:AcrR family transcriptional regulator